MELTAGNSFFQELCTSYVGPSPSWDNLGDALLRPACEIYGLSKSVVVLQDLVDKGAACTSNDPLQLLSNSTAAPTGQNEKWYSTAKKLTFAVGGSIIRAFTGRSRLVYEALPHCSESIILDPGEEPSHTQNIQALYNFYVNGEDAKAPFFAQLISQPDAFLSYGVGTTTFTPLGFTECSCPNTMEFHRAASPRRKDFEARIVKDVATLQPDKEGELSILSMGSEGLLEDWIIAGKLLQEGYKNLRFVFVDPALDMKKVQRFEDFFQGMEGVAVSASGHHNVGDIDPANAYFDIATAIDYDDFYGARFGYGTPALDLIKAKNLLREGGKLYAGFGMEDLVIDQSGATEALNDRGMVQAIASDLVTHFSPNKEGVATIALSIFPGILPMLMGTFDALKRKGIKQANIVVDAGKDSRFGLSPRELIRFAQEYCYSTPGVTIATKREEGDRYDLVLTGFAESPWLQDSNVLNDNGIAVIAHADDVVRKSSQEEKTLYTNQDSVLHKLLAKAKAK